MPGRKIQIEFLGNNRDLDRAMDGSINRSKKFGDALKKAGKVAALGLAVGAALAAKELFDMTKGAIEDEAAQKRLAKQLKNSTGATKEQVSAVEDWISAQGTALGVTDDDLRPALAKLAQATGDVGEAQELAALAMDASAARGKSLEATSKALADAEDGRLGGLAKLGIETKNAAGETLSLDKIHANMAKTFKGAAASSANTLEGKMGRLKLTLSEAGETIGAKLIPVVTKMADWFLQKGLPALTKFGAYLQEKLPPIFEKIRAVVQKVFGGLKGDVGGPIGDIKSIVQDAVSIITSLWARFGGTITEYARKSFANIKQIIGGALTVIKGIFKTVSSLLKGDWKGAWDGIKMILRGAVDVIVGLVKQLAAQAVAILKIGWSSLKGVTSAAWDGIKNATVAGARRLVDYVKGIPGRLKSAIGNLASVLYNAGVDLVAGFLNGIKDKAADIPGIIKDAVTDKIPGPLLRASKGIKIAGADLLASIISGIESKRIPLKNVLEKVTSVVQAAGEKLSGLLSDRGSFAEGFSAFTTSLFGADMTDPETGASTASVSSIKAFADAARAKAEKLQADVKKLVGMGLSNDLLTQLQANGSTGVNQISALAAGASKTDIAALNATNNATNDALMGAGMSAGNAIYGDRIMGAIAEQKNAQDLLDKLDQVRDDLAKNQEATVTIKDGAIVVAIRNVEKKTGKKLLATPA